MIIVSSGCEEGRPPCYILRIDNAQGLDAIAKFALLICGEVDFVIGKSWKFWRAEEPVTLPPRRRSPE